MTVDEKHDYIRAVDCMFSSPAQTDPSLAGTRVRFDDFAAQHINQTLDIHVTVCFSCTMIALGIATKIRRAIFLLGIDTISGPTSRLCEMNVVIKATFL